MATAYSAQVTFKNKSGAGKIYNLTSSDVAGEFWLFASGSNGMIINASEDVFLVDAIVSTAGGTTKNVEVFIGGVSTGTTVNINNLVGTIVQRSFQIAPMRIPAGQILQFTQRA